ncbi:MAG: methionyl-tRNA formyltransferase [Firmicutes bacterium]|nr:methionyl-tRNA formyltransferase [Bacillota bacterium]
MYNIVFMGTPDFAANILERMVAEKKYNIVLAVSQPDRPKNRGKKLQPTSVKVVAERENIPVYQPESVKTEEFYETLKATDADFFVVVAYGRILTQQVLDIPKKASVNIHGSLLPEYRGAAPIQRAIIDGKQKTGITTMLMAKECDCGDMLLKAETDIEKYDTYGSLHDKLCALGGELIIKTLDGFDDIHPQKQDDNLATYADMIHKDTGKICWSKNSRETECLTRGLDPAPGAYTNYGDEVLKIWKCQVLEDRYEGECGSVITADPKQGLIVKTGDTALKILEIQAKGGKRMKTEDYLRGHSIEVGSVLGK